MVSLMENQIVDAILKHPCISAKTNKKIRIKINTLRKYLRKHYNIKVEQQEIIQVIEKYLSNKFIVDKKGKPILLNKNKSQVSELKNNVETIRKIQKVLLLGKYLDKCPICRTKFKNIKVSLPYYISKPCIENLLGYIEANALYCSNCEEYFMDVKNYKEIKKEHMGQVIDARDFNKLKSAYINNSVRPVSKYFTGNTTKDIYKPAAHKVINNIYIIFECQKKCFCGNDLVRQAISIRNKINYNSYFSYNVLHCKKCNQYYITNSEYKANKYIIGARIYFFKPKEEISVERFYYLCNSKYRQLNKESFLHILGYNVSDKKLTNNERLKILDYAVMLFGLTRVASHIKYLIKDRSNQKNGLKRYARALRIWNHDLNYIINNNKMYLSEF